jgi:Mis6
VNVSVQQAEKSTLRHQTVSQMHSLELKKVRPPPSCTNPASTSRIDKGILNNAVTTITSHAESNGLTTQQIGQLINVLVLPDALDRVTTHQLIKSLYPASKIDEDVAVKIIGCLGLGAERAALQTQVCAVDFEC